MPIIKDKKIQKEKKIYFVYFIFFSIIILVIFSFIIIGTFWDYWAELRDIEKFYKSQAEETLLTLPEINRFDPIKGGASAQVTIYEYSDFLCQPCQTLQQDLATLEKNYGNKLRFVFKGTPVTLNLETRPSLNAAYCAHEQGQFWAYKDLLYQEPILLTNQKYLEYASQLNLDLENFSQCLESGKYSSVVEKNLVDALSMQITSVPTLYINDQKVEGFINYNTVRGIIETELKK